MAEGKSENLSGAEARAEFESWWQTSADETPAIDMDQFKPHFYGLAAGITLLSAGMGAAAGSRMSSVTGELPHEGADVLPMEEAIAAEAEVAAKTGTSAAESRALNSVKNGIHPSVEELPVSVKAPLVATRAFLYGTALAVGGVAIGIHFTFKALGVKDSKEFAAEMKRRMPPWFAPVRERMTPLTAKIHEHLGEGPLVVTRTDVEGRESKRKEGDVVRPVQGDDKKQ